MFQILTRWNHFGALVTETNLFRYRCQHIEIDEHFSLRSTNCHYLLQWLTWCGSSWLQASSGGFWNAAQKKSAPYWPGKNTWNVWLPLVSMQGWKSCHTYNPLSGQPRTCSKCGNVGAFYGCVTIGSIERIVSLGGSM